jgi:hypothetical protein
MTELELAAVKTGDIKLSERIIRRRRKPITTDEEFEALVRERPELALAVLNQLTTPNCEPSKSEPSFV